MGYFAYYIIDFPVKLRLFSDSNRNLQNIFFIIIIQHWRGLGEGARDRESDYENRAALQSTSLVALRITRQIFCAHVHTFIYSHK